MMVSKASLFVRMTDRFSSQHLLKTPSTPVTPIPLIISLVSRNGTYLRCARVVRTIGDRERSVKMRKIDSSQKVDGTNPAQVFSALTLAQRQHRAQCAQLLRLLGQSGCSWNVDHQDPQYNQPIFQEKRCIKSNK